MASIAATGFGRYGISFRDIQITEITSVARGAFYLNPQTRVVLDIGSQSTRAIGLRDAGRVRAFKTNDKCAAGSGSFIQRAAKYLQVGIEDVGELALNSENAQPISSVCAVLAESDGRAEPRAVVRKGRRPDEGYGNRERLRGRQGRLQGEGSH